MAEEKEIITQDVEDKQVKEEVEKKEETVEGTMETQLAEENVEEIQSKPAQETVPLSVYLGLKDDVKTLKKDIKEAKASSKSAIVTTGVEDLSKKYPDVDENFIQDILQSATSKAQSEIDKKYSPIIEKQESERKQVAFDTAFDNLYSKTLQDNPDLPKSIDKELIKDLAITPKYRNVPLSKIISKMYGNVENEGSSSSENEMRSSADKVEDIVDFDKITPEQRKLVMADPKARQKFFDALDGI